MLDNKKLVSVIIPVFNVEDYLKECIESVLNQTYQNLEIILVDDGSTDNSGQICDDYAQQDKRVKVIHKKNGGLSDARNIGIKNSIGEYISFIDSDDYVSSYFVEILVKEMEDNNVDLVALTRGIDFWDGETEVKLAKRVDDYNVGVVSAEKALEQMLYQKIATGAPFKFYKRKCFDKILFPVGYLYEDVATTYKAFIYAENVAIVDSRLYAYRKRANSIIRREFREDKLVAIEIGKTLINDISEYNPSLHNAAVSRAFAMIFSVFLQIPYDRRDLLHLCWKELQKYRCTVALDFNKYMRKKNRYASYISFGGMFISYVIGKKFGRKGAFN